MTFLFLRLDEPQIGDVDEGVVEGRENAGNAKDELALSLQVSNCERWDAPKDGTFANLRSEGDVFLRSALDLLLWGHDLSDCDSEKVPLRLSKWWSRCGCGAEELRFRQTASLLYHAYLGKVSVGGHHQRVRKIEGRKQSIAWAAGNAQVIPECCFFRLVDNVSSPAVSVPSTLPP